MPIRLEEHERGKHHCQNFAERVLGVMMCCKLCLNTWHEHNVIRNRPTQSLLFSPPLSEDTTNP